MKSNKQNLLPLDVIEVMQDELVYVSGGTGKKNEGSSTDSGCGCSSGKDCGCDCKGGAGCGCGCTAAE